GGLAGFLILNRPPARVFMGDGGALFVGALLAVATVLLSRPNMSAPSAAPALVLGVFLFDTSYTLVKRLLAGEPVLQAHCRHLYQRLVKAGWDSKKVCWVYLALNLTAGLGALALVHADIRYHGFVWVIIISACIGLLGIVRRTEHHHSMLVGSQRS